MSSPSDSSTRGRWSSGLAFILVTSGATIGLGNIWKFPYVIGHRGGGAFLLLHLIFLFVIALPLMLSEMLVGRRGHQNTVTSIQLLSSETNASQRWQWLGWLYTITLVLILSYYTVVAGWALAYLIHTWHGDLQPLSQVEIIQYWRSFVSKPGPMIFWHTLFMLMTMGIVARGVKKGIEKASKTLIFLTFIILILMLGYAMSTQHFFESLSFLFDVDFSKITADMVVVTMGFTFLTVSLGAGSILMYSSYASKEVSLGKSAVSVLLLDFVVSLLITLTVYSILFAHNLAAYDVDGVIFVVLPIAFSKMQGGIFVGGLFFLMTVCAAWTSAISLVEPLVALISERLKIKRFKAALLACIPPWLIGIFLILSLTENSFFFIKFPANPSVYHLVSYFATIILLPLGGLLLAIFTGWVLHRRITREELNFKTETTYMLWRFLIRWVVPLSISIVFLYPIISYIKIKDLF